MPIRAKTLLRRQPHKEYRPDAGARGYDAQWQRIRLDYLRRNPICTYASTTNLPHRCMVAARIVDHIKPLSRGGARLDESNFRPVCRACHDAITANLNRTGINEMPYRQGGRGAFFQDRLPPLTDPQSSTRGREIDLGGSK